MVGTFISTNHSICITHEMIYENISGILRTDAEYSISMLNLEVIWVYASLL